MPAILDRGHALMCWATKSAGTRPVLNRRRLAVADDIIRVLSFGAGVQSSTLLRMMIHGEIEPAQHAVFSDTGWEPRSVYDHMKKMRAEAEAAGIEFHIVSNGNLREDALNIDHRFASMPVHVVNMKGYPALGRRQCTSEYKIKPLTAKQRELAGLKPGERCKQHRITTIIGISWDESQRMKDPLFPWIRNEYPLIDRRLTRSDCLDWNDRHGYVRPPRSSCIGCPFHSNNEWRAIRENPEDWANAVEFDHAIRQEPVASRMFEGRAFLHPQRVPLDQVDLRTVEEKGQLNMFEMECEGMCGL